MGELFNRATMKRGREREREIFQLSINHRRTYDCIKGGDSGGGSDGG